MPVYFIFSLEIWQLQGLATVHCGNGIDIAAMRVTIMVGQGVG